MKTNPKHLMHSFQHTPDIEGNVNGLTKREHFAAMAMQGLLAGYPNYMPYESEISKAAVEMADALINALNN